jgi:hypothetical protein
VATPVKLPNLPINVKQCIARHVKVPQGDWTVSIIADVVAKYRRREIELEDCLSQVEAFYVDLQQGLAKPTGRLSKLLRR